MDQITSFGYWVRRQRKALDLTQAALARQVGCATITIRKIERDERRPSPEMAELLADYLAIGDSERLDFLDMARGRYVEEIEAPATLIDASATFPPTPIPNNLPTHATAFIGREDELAALDTLLLKPDVRLITIVGPGGMGKTRLALASAERFIGADDEMLFRDGVFFVSLAPLSDPDHIIPAMAEAFNFPLESGGGQQRSGRQQILDYLTEKQMLLLLDNFEHLLAGVELVGEILQAASQVQILATSRERLRLRTEQIFTIEGLEFPDWETPKDAAEYTAVKLFLQSAQRVRHGFELGQADLTYLTRICRLVGGMPLGVELAAAWVDMLSLEEIAAEIQRSVDFLETEMRDMPERHSSMRAVFAASWQRLSQAEQETFVQLAIFRGGFDRAAGQDIVGASLRTLSGLINKSLLQYNQQTGRYQVHELLRQFGEEKLDAQKHLANSVRDRHSSYYCQLLQKHEAELKAAGQQKALVEIETDVENIRLAWQRAVQNRNIDALTNGMDSLGYFHEWRGRFQNGEVMFRSAAEALATDTTSTSLLARARLLAWQSVFVNILQEDEQAVALCQQALAILNHDALATTNTQQVEALILYEQGRSGHDYGQRNEALKQSVTISRNYDNSWNLANALQLLGDPSSWSLSLNDCETYLAECLAIRRRLGDRRGTAQALWAQHGVASFKGEFERSLALAEEALRISEEVGIRSSPAFTNLGWHFIHVNELDRAASELDRSIYLCQRLGDKFGVCFGHWSLYHVELARGNLERAIRQVKIVEELTLPSWLWEVGEIPIIQKRYDDAVTTLSKNLTQAIATQQPMQTVSSLAYLSMAEHGRGRIEHARHFAFKSLEIPVDFQHFMITQISLPSVTNLMAEEGDLERAIEIDALTRARHPWYDRSWGMAMLRQPFTERIAGLPPETIAAARERGRQLDYWQTTTQLLEELKKKGWDKEPVSGQFSSTSN